MSTDRPQDPLADLIGDGDDIYGKADKGRIKWTMPGGEDEGAPPQPGGTADPGQSPHAPAGSPLGEDSDTGKPAPDQNPYGSFRAREVLEQLINSGHPALVADAMDQFLRRLALLELWIEEQDLEVDEGTFSAFLSAHPKAVDDATYQLAQLLFGRVATREGG